MFTRTLVLALLFLAVFTEVFAQTAGVRPIVSTNPASEEMLLPLQQYFHDKTDGGELAGTVILLANGERQWTDVYGYQNLEKQVPMSSTTIFRIASMTKPIVSAATMMLVEQGRLRLEDPIRQFIPAFDQVKVLDENQTYHDIQRPITVHDLLTHTSGIANNFFRNTAAEKVYGETFRTQNPGSLKELVDILATLPLAHQPGEKWTYGFSTDVLARVLEIVTGESIDLLLQKQILQPLKMNDTGFQVPADKLSRFASAYGKEMKVLDPADRSSSYVNGKNYARGAGGLASTVSDYLRFCRMMLNGGELDGVRLLKPESVQMMMRNQLSQGLMPESPGMPLLCRGFGLGFGVQTDEPVFGNPGDCGWPGSYLTYFFIDPSNKGIGILMTQTIDFTNLPMIEDFHRLASTSLQQML